MVIICAIQTQKCKRLGIDVQYDSLVQSSTQVTQVLPHQTWQTKFLCSLLCTQEHCHAGTDLGILVSVKAIAYKHILDRCVFPTYIWMSHMVLWPGVYKQYYI